MRPPGGRMMRIPQDQALIHVCFTAKSNGAIKASRSRIRGFTSASPQNPMEQSKPLGRELGNCSQSTSRRFSRGIASLRYSFQMRCEVRHTSRGQSATGAIASRGVQLPFEGKWPLETRIAPGNMLLYHRLLLQEPN